MLHDDRLGRTLDWLYAHDPTALFAGIAHQARARFAVSTRQVHVDTTSFAVSGEYAPEADAQTIAVTYGYSRDHRADLKQWMLALATTRDGDVPLFCRSLDGNSSDKVSLVAAVEALAAQLRASAADEAEDSPIFVADSGLYSAENIARLNTAGVRWISRVPETSTEAQTALAVSDSAWQQDGERFWVPAAQAPTGERWVIVRTTQGENRARATLRRKVEQTRTEWERQLWHLSNRRFACQPDAQAALAQQLKGRPEWLDVQTQLVAHPRHGRPGRPRQGTAPARQEWQLVAKVRVNETEVAHQVRRRASFVVATNVTDPRELPDHELIQIYQDQGSVERGFAFLKDPLFLPSSVFVKKPERIVALSLIMVLCLLVYRLAEHRLRTQLAATGQTVPNQLSKPTNRPTMRWLFQCFEGISLVVFQPAFGPPRRAITTLEPLHQQVLALLGASCACFYHVA